MSEANTNQAAVPPQPTEVNDEQMDRAKTTGTQYHAGESIELTELWTDSVANSTFPGAAVSTTQLIQETEPFPEEHIEVPVEQLHPLYRTRTVTVSSAFAPVDGGKDAWLVLVAAFLMEALIWGFPYSFGVFEQYYASNKPFSDDVSSIAVIGTSANGMLFFLAPPVYCLLRSFAAGRKTGMIVGFAIMVSSLIAASFMNSTAGLLATQGIIYGIGGALENYPVFLYLDEWWLQKRGFAYGVVFCGSGASGLAIPLLMQWLLNAYGFRTALRIWALVTFVLTLPALFVIKGRLPTQHAATGPQQLDWTFLKSKAFWLMQAGNIIWGLGYFMPSLYLPSFAEAVGHSPLTGTIALSLINAASVPGCLFAGFLIDRYPVTTAMNFCAIGTIFAVFLFWTFSIYTPMLFLFAILYGFTAGGYGSTWAGVVYPVRARFPQVEAGMIVCLFSAGKGVGAVVSGPLSGMLVRSDAWKNNLGFAFGSGYGYLILFSGVTAALSMVGWVGKKFKLFA